MQYVHDSLVDQVRTHVDAATSEPHSAVRTAIAVESCYLIINSE